MLPGRLCLLPDQASLKSHPRKPSDVRHEAVLLSKNLLLLHRIVDRRLLEQIRLLPTLQHRLTIVNHLVEGLSKGLVRYQCKEARPKHRDVVGHVVEVYQK